MIVLNNRIKELRARLNMSQGLLAEYVGVTRNTISNIESGRTTPDIVKGLQIAEALQTPFDEVFKIETLELEE